MKVDPQTANVSLWLKNLSRTQLHEQGWIAVNQRFHGIARAARPFIQTNFPDTDDQAAAFDGFTLALLTIAHFEDIAELSGLFKADSIKRRRKTPLNKEPIQTRKPDPTT